MKLTYALPLAHNIITVDTIKTSKYSLLAAIAMRSSVRLSYSV